MSDVEDGCADPREELLKVHRKEKKDLQAQIQALKKTASKGDKKKKKEVTESIAQLEANLEAKHKSELELLDSNPEPVVNGSSSEAAVEVLTNGVSRLGEDSDDGALGPLPIKEGNTNRVSKAQKRRDKKAAKERERLEEIAAQEELNKTGPRVREQESIRAKLVERQLKLKEIPSDGDCMFAGLVHQLSLLGIAASVPSLRQQTVQELQENSDQYLPFLTNDSGDMLSESEFAAYCDKMRNTPAWGGQIELRALSTVLKKPIQVIQGTGPDIVVGGEEQEEAATSEGPLILTYHRHLHGLGEHYNSVTRISS